MEATARANSNLALVKYWGKRNEELILPFNSSISVTLDGLSSVTSCEFSEKHKEDVFVLNSKVVKDKKKVSKVLDIVRSRSGVDLKAKVSSRNNFPTAAGLASSASGIAALALAATKAVGLNLNSQKLSQIARQGSGSASRSIAGGFVEWKKGKRDGGKDSYAYQLAPPSWWPEFRVIVVITTEEKKKISSRAGMKQTVETSPYYQGWLEEIREDLNGVKEAIESKDLEILGQIAEHNCLKMHATMFTTSPAIIYWNATTMKVIRSVIEWREIGLKCYFTIDAGPQVKILCLEESVQRLCSLLDNLEDVKEIKIAKVGEAAMLTDETALNGGNHGKI